MKKVANSAEPIRVFVIVAADQLEAVVVMEGVIVAVEERIPAAVVDSKRRQAAVDHTS